MSEGKTKVAIVYDFDGTLAPGDIPSHSLLPELLNEDVAVFWKTVKEQTKEHDADEVLIYMHLLLMRAQALGLSLTPALFAQHGARTPLFDGVETWFDRINDHGHACGLQLEHYIISSGLREMIVATRIAHQFKSVFACKYLYDEQQRAIAPSVAVNYTTKTQFLFRINKGIDNIWDNEGVNRWLPMTERPMPFERLIYLGDGDTDIPSMKMVRFQKGTSVAVFDPAKFGEKKMQTRVYNLIAENRADFVVPADYRDGSQLDLTMKGVLGRIARDYAGYRDGAV